MANVLILNIHNFGIRLFPTDKFWLNLHETISIEIYGNIEN